MSLFALLLACLVFSSFARRLQIVQQRSHAISLEEAKKYSLAALVQLQSGWSTRQSHSFKSFRMLLSKDTPAVGFQSPRSLSQRQTNNPNYIATRLVRPRTSLTKMILQRPWYAGFVSDLVVGPMLSNFGLTEERQKFSRTAYEENLSPRMPTVSSNGVVSKDYSMPSADGKHQNGARLYTPMSPVESMAPLVVFMHGGGWCLNSCFRQPYDFLCAKLCRELGCCVISIDYRLAPEHPWPAAVEDVYSSLEWLAQQTNVAPNADRQRIVLIGESSGGNLAACVSQMCRDRLPAGIRIAHQVLISPCMLARPLRPSRTDPARANGAFLPAWSMIWFEEQYAGNLYTVEELSKQPYANPLAATNLDGVAPLTGVVGGAEVLRDECVEYFEALKSAGVNADWKEFEGGYHSFPVFPFGQAEEAWQYVYERLRRMPGLFQAKP